MIKSLKLIFVLALTALLTSVQGQLHAGLFDVGDQVKAELTAERDTFQPGKPFTLGLKLSHAPHWHTYWINPGTGYATSLTWELPDGFSAGDIQWPVPIVYKQGNLVNYVLEGESLLLIRITPPADIQTGDSFTLKARADWLMCDDSHCVPGDASLEITLTATGETETSSSRNELFSHARSQLPARDKNWNLRAGSDGKRIVLIGGSKQIPSNIPESLYFFSFDGSIDQESAQKFKINDQNKFSLELKKSATVQTLPDRLHGVLASPEGKLRIDGHRGLYIDIPLSPDMSGMTVNPTAAITDSDSTLPEGKLAGILFLAFVGGLILNLMPCVFPVLGIKILGFVQQAGQDRKKVIMHGLIFALGVLVSFWLLSGLLLVLRAGGEQLGWGFQLQSPAFTLGLTVFLFVFALNLSGVFEFGHSTVGIGSRLMGKQGLAGSFFSGVLATVVSTPCAAPFLAPALGSALALPPAISILVFTFIALGLSAPYLVLSSFPGLINLLPRPGAWMETFKQLMAFPLYATAAYLLWGYIALVPEEKLLNGLIALTIIAMAVWIYGRFCNPSQKAKKRRIYTALAVLLLLAGGILAFKPTYKHDWEPWSAERLQELREQNRIVYVDFTARWCATCQVNKRVVFGNDAIRQEFKKKNVALLKGDWTNRDTQITEELRKFNRSAVPFNLIYFPDTEEPVILPEILTPGIVLEVLDQ